MSHKIFVMTSVFIAILLSICLYGIFKMHIPNKADVLETHEIYDYIKKQIPHKPLVQFYISPMNHQNIVTVYGVNDDGARAKLISNLKIKVKETKWKPLVISFYKTENWIELGNRRIRGKEEIISTTQISNDGLDPQNSNR